MKKLLIFGFFCFTASVDFHAMAEPAAVPAIPVVHTWGDLEDAPTYTVQPKPRVTKEGNVPYHVPPGPLPKLPPVTFRVGISSDQATSHGGLLLYFTCPGRTGWASPENEGLYFLVVDGPQKGGTGYGGFFYSPETTIDPKDGQTFHAEMIPFGPAGKYTVELVKVGETEFPAAPFNVIARATVTVKDKPEERWFPFWDKDDSSGGADSGDNPDGSSYAIVPILNPTGGAAMPKAPYIRNYAQLPGRDQSLPVLISDTTDHNGVHLAMKDTTLMVKFDPRIEGFFPDDYFLTRWWVNGKQIDLDPTVSIPGQSRALGMAAVPHRLDVSFRPPDLAPLVTATPVWYTREVHFEFSFMPERLGVKKGDKVALQLLFCPSGWRQSNGMDDDLLDSEDGTPPKVPPDHFSEMSNQIGFTYSGDPKHPQQ